LKFESCENQIGKTGLISAKPHRSVGTMTSSRTPSFGENKTSTGSGAP
jgi:hypothetical protein